MRLPVLLAAFAALTIAMPAAAQKAPPPKPEPLRPDRVSAGDLKTMAVAPTSAADPENTWLLDLSSGGRVVIRLRPDVAPKMVERVKTLTRRKFYDGLAFFRVNDAPEGMAQGGDPKNNGTGESDLPDLEAEFSRVPHLRGTVSAARKGAPENASAEQITAAHNSANSQFFIMFTPKLSFDQNYTAFGRVISGMEWVDKMERGEPPSNPTRIVHAYIAADNPPEFVAPKVELPAGEEEVTLPDTPPAKPQ